jgi:EmrB/QacA subfamily drug resistance transporter
MFETTVPQSPPTPCPPPRSAPRWSLVAAILGSTMAFVDGTVVNVALPVMQRELGARVDAMQWVVEAYALVLASLVLVGGALGDRLGRRRVFVAGVVVFAAASAACGLAPSTPLLVGARAVQGIGAALLVPGSLALIGAAYPEEGRGRAIGTWSAVTSVAAAVGPVLGGWVIAHGSWRWVFFFNVPLGAVVVPITVRRVGESRDVTAPSRIDVRGALLVMSGLGALVWALLEAPAGGLGAPRTVLSLAVGAALLIAFLVVEARAAAPMMPLVLFQSPTFAATNLATLLLYAALGGCLFFLPFDLVQVQRYSPAAAGASLLPFVALVASLSPWAGGLATRRGARLPLTVGPAVAAVGFALLTFPSVGGTFWTTFFPGVAVLGIGMGVTVAPLTTSVMTSVESRHAGLASGINNAVARAAGVLAVAALGALLVARFDRVASARLAPIPLSPEVRASLDAQRSKLVAVDLPPELDEAVRGAVRAALDAAFVAGFRAATLVSAALAALAGVAGFLSGRRRS